MNQKRENMEETLKFMLDLMIPEDHPKAIQNTIRQSEAGTETDKHHRL